MSVGRDLHLPSDGDAHTAAVVLHPHPGMGGDRHHPLVVTIAEGLAAQGVAALRVDLTDPDPDVSVGALEAVIADLLGEVGVDRLVLVGYSWGAAVTARAQHPALAARVLVAPPGSMLAGALEAAPTGSVPTLVLVPAHDQFGPPDAAREAVGDRPGIEVEVIDGCDHFLMGAVSRIAERATGWLAEV